jgi:hypothetical protein
MATGNKNITKKVLTQGKEVKPIPTPKKPDPVFILVEGLPKLTYGLSDSAYNSLIANLKGLLVENKNHMVFPITSKPAVTKIIRDKFSGYVVRYAPNKDKGTCSVWRTA